MIYIILTLSVDFCLLSGLLALDRYIKKEKEKWIGKNRLPKV